MFNKRTQEIVKKASELLNNIKEEDNRKKFEVERTFHKHFAFLPTRLSSGKLIFFRFYYARYKAKHVKYIKIVHNDIIVTDIYKHYIDKDFEPDLGLPIEKII
jgi:hypothetical protein